METTTMHITIKNQLITGIYIWPIRFFDVWMIFSIGKHPRAMDCFTQENVADIIAWLAIMAARVAITKTGQKRAPVVTQESIGGSNFC